MINRLRGEYYTKTENAKISCESLCRVGESHATIKSETLFLMHQRNRNIFDTRGISIQNGNNDIFHYSEECD